MVFSIVLLFGLCRNPIFVSSHTLKNKLLPKKDNTGSAGDVCGADVKTHPLENPNVNHVNQECLNEIWMYLTSNLFTWIQRENPEQQLKSLTIDRLVVKYCLKAKED